MASSILSSVRKVEEDLRACIEERSPVSWRIKLLSRGKVELCVTYEEPEPVVCTDMATWRFSQASPLSLPNPRRLAPTGSLCYIRPKYVQRRCPFLARPSEAR